MKKNIEMYIVYVCYNNWNIMIHVKVVTKCTAKSSSIGP